MRRRGFRGQALLVAVVVGAALALPACGGGGATKTFVGKVQGSDAYIALVSTGTQVGGYLCDGNTVSTWLGVTDVSGGKASLVTRQGRALGDATPSGDRASGTVAIGGADHGFTAQVATGKAGLYRAVRGTLGQPGSVEVGWIVLPDGSQRGGTNLIDQAGTLMVQMAPMLNTSSTTVNLSGFGVLMVRMVSGPDSQRWIEGKLPY